MGLDRQEGPLTTKTGLEPKDTEQTDIGSTGTEVHHIIKIILLQEGASWIVLWSVND